ncbi:hypothetical protein HZA38_04470 [Candidatus Peregrinibacteria bacterium]|nr:hypothetical protein [Candidatus Peregrinibacteria bacterium]
MKSILKYIFGSLLLFLSFGNGFAFAGNVEIHVHKNTYDGDEWTSSIYPIKITITDVVAGTPLGITETHGLDIDPALGALKLRDTPLECHFEWPNPDPDIPEKIIKDKKVNVYEQMLAGEFIVPPVRIIDERILVANKVPKIMPFCGGSTEAEYDEFEKQIVNSEIMPDNPYRIYQNYLSLATEGKITTSIAKPLEPQKIDTTNPDQILGYGCQVEMRDEKGEIVRDKTTGNPIMKNGLCEASGDAKIDLIVLSDASEPVIRATIDDPLVQGVNAEVSELVTMVGNFAIRTTSLLDWALAIDETGFRNEKITLVYNKALNIVNGFFILALIIIALLWNFSMIIAKEQLKRMVILFVIGGVCVYFALPLTRLLVDGTNILQRTLLVKQEAGDSEVQSAIQVYGGELAKPGLSDAERTRIQTQLDALRNSLKTKRISASDILSAYDIDYGGFVGLQKTIYVSKDYPTGDDLTVNDQSKFVMKDDLFIDRFQERTYFNLTLIGLGAIAQFLIAMILLFRYVILWFLLIFSPFLLVLALFNTTRFLFRYWVWLYARWLLIGPILAMTLYIVVNIWSLTGVPLESAYNAPSSLIFPNTTNLYVAAPGVTSGYLNTPREVMKYISALMMLYMAVILPFWLTRYIRGEMPTLSAKFFEKKKKFFTPEGPLTVTPTQEPPQKPELQKPIKTELSEMPTLKTDLTNMPPVPVTVVAHTDSQGKETEKDNQISTQQVTREAGTRESTKTETSTHQTTSTKDLINTLNILQASQTLSKSVDMKSARMESQKDRIVSEIQKRAERGDTIAIKAIGKIDATADITANVKAKADVSANAKVHADVIATERRTTHVTQTAPDISSPEHKTAVGKAHEEIEKSSLVSHANIREQVESEQKAKSLEREKERLVSKSPVAEEVTQKSREDALKKMVSGSSPKGPEDGVPEKGPDIPPQNAKKEEKLKALGKEGPPQVDAPQGTHGPKMAAALDLASPSDTPDTGGEPEDDSDLYVERTHEKKKMKTFDEELDFEDSENSGEYEPPNRAESKGQLGVNETEEKLEREGEIESISSEKISPVFGENFEENLNTNISATSGEKRSERKALRNEGEEKDLNAPDDDNSDPQDKKKSGSGGNQKNTKAQNFPDVSADDDKEESASNPKKINIEEEIEREEKEENITAISQDDENKIA